MEIRFNSPYKYALAGLATELVAIIVFLLLAVGLVLAAAWIA